MPTSLQSPGVSVSVVNESFYTPAAPGTVPLIFVASASNKTNPSGVVAAGTTAANAGKVYLITGQRDLVDTFGTPLFYTDNSGNPVHGGELNEYGLQAAYSYLGASAAAYITRAPVDLSSLIATSSEPTGAPADGAHWVDTSSSKFGIFEWNATTQSFTNKVPYVIDDSNSAIDTDGSDGITPKASVGVVGQYAMVITSQNQCGVWFKNTSANWVKVGSIGETGFLSSTPTFTSSVWSSSWPAVSGTTTPASLTAVGILVVNGVTINILSGYSLTDVATAINTDLHGKGVGAKIVNGALCVYADANAASDGVNADGAVAISGDTAVLSEIGIAAKSYNSPTVFVGPHTQYPDFSLYPTGSAYIKTTLPNSGANWVLKKYSATSGAFNLISSPIYSNATTALFQLDVGGGGANIPAGALYIEGNYNHGNNFHSTSTSLCLPVVADFKVLQRQRPGAQSATRITSVASTASVTINSTFSISVTTPGSVTPTMLQSLSVSGGKDAFVASINNSGIANLSAANNADGSVTVSHATGGEIMFVDSSNVLAAVGFSAGTTANFYVAGSAEPLGVTHKASNWKPLTFVSSSTTPSSAPVDGQLWYNSIIDEVDILYHNGTTWVGYGVAFPNTDSNGPIVSATAPTTQSDGVTALVNGDVWVSTADIERYGLDIYVWNGSTLKWDLQDPTDQTSPTGWLFANARWATSGSTTAASTITALRNSSYLDPDCPDPAEYPRGMRLWNLRRSGFNVKQYVANYINLEANNGQNIRYNNEPMNGSNSTPLYKTGRWVSVSPNNADGSGTFGRHAQRSYVVESIKALVDGNQSIRDTDTLSYNLIACPGYPEAIANMITLNIDRGLTAFVIGDTPFRLLPTGTDLKAYGLNSNGAFDNGDTGAVSYNEYMGMFYPSGYTNDLTGSYIVVPPSHMMLRTIAISDQKSYPWFAPAGIRRGVVDNVTSVGYLSNGEFRSAALPQGVRDVMASVKINPIATITGAGIINFGQYTRANAASALDRINVARLVAHVRRQLDILVRPYIFEPNDKITRAEVRNAVQSFFLELVSQRAIYDFIVVCDESNNTAARIDRSELWVDVAIEPTKAVEFVYIPIRLVNTGAIKAGTYSLA